MGGEAGDALTDADDNVAVGALALSGDTLGSQSVAIGRGALKVQNFTTATNTLNVAVGYSAGESVTSGTSNTLIGGQSGDALTGGARNVAVGAATLTNDTLGQYAIAIGYGALSTQNFTTATNDYNIGIGYLAGENVTTGVQNVFIGGLAGDALTDADSNVAIGMEALTADTLGSRSTAVGYNTLATQNFTTATFSYNTAVGYTAGTAVTTGLRNTLLGSFAGHGISTGFENVLVGYAAGDVLTTGNNNVMVGISVDPSSNSVSNSIALGSGFVVDGNDFSFGKASNVVTNDFNADANWSRSSDLRLKKNVVDQTLGLSFINDLRTVKYNWKANGELDASDAQLAHLREEDENGDIINHMDTEVTMHNFIAQEVKAALDTAGVSDFGGWKEDRYGVQQVSREMFVIPLVKAVQEQSALITALTARVAALES